MASGMFLEKSSLYGPLEKRILRVGEFGKITVPQLLGIRPLPVVIGCSVTIIGFWLILESMRV